MEISSGPDILLCSIAVIVIMMALGPHVCWFFFVVLLLIYVGYCVCLHVVKFPKYLPKASFVNFFFSIYAERNRTRSKRATLFHSNNSCNSQNIHKCTKQYVNVLRPHVSCPYICLVNGH